MPVDTSTSAGAVAVAHSAPSEIAYLAGIFILICIIIYLFAMAFKEIYRNFDE